MKIFSPLNQAAGDNLLINGDFNIAQRIIPPAALTDDNPAVDRDHVYDACDRWSITVAEAGAAMFNVARGFYDLMAVPGDMFGSRRCLRVQMGSAGYAPNATSCVYVSQKIERGVTRLAASTQKNLTFSCIAGAVAGADRIGVALVLNYGTGGSPNVIIPGRSFTVATSATGRPTTKVNHTFTLPSTTGKVITDDNYIELIIGFVWGTTIGTNYFNDVAAGTGASGCDNMIAQAKLEIGTQVTPFQPGSYQTDLIECMRYYQTLNLDRQLYATFGSGLGISAIAAHIFVPLSVPMRIIPTAGNVAQVGDLGVMTPAGGVQAVTGFTYDPTNCCLDKLYVIVDTAAGLVQGHGTMLFANNDADGSITASAEI